MTKLFVAATGAFIAGVAVGFIASMAVVLAMLAIAAVERISTARQF